MNPFGKSSSRESERGAALVVAIGAAVVVALTAGMVLNTVMRRFELSAVRTDRLDAMNTSEAGTRYAWIRLDVEGTGAGSLDANVRAKGNGNVYIIASVNDAGAAASVGDNAPISGEPIDEVDAALTLGDKVMEVRITSDNTLPAPAEFQVEVLSDYGFR